MDNFKPAIVGIAWSFYLIAWALMVMAIYENTLHEGIFTFGFVLGAAQFLLGAVHTLNLASDEWD